MSEKQAKLSGVVGYIMNQACLFLSEWGGIRVFMMAGCLFFFFVEQKIAFKH
jgi:hypothetical protein